MNKKGLSQETLKIIACITMLIDHIGSVFVSGYTLRIIGRIAFPIYCFLMAEGTYYTKNPKKYAFRLFIGMLLSEIPFDLALRGRFTLGSQSVMVTLLLGFLAVEAVQTDWCGVLKFVCVGGCCAAAQLAHTDYGGKGVMLIVLLSQCRGKWWLQTLCVLIFAQLCNSASIPVFGKKIPIEMFAVFAMIPIGLYSGRKSTSSVWVQRAFYLFYPVHLAVLAVLRFTLK